MSHDSDITFVLQRIGRGDNEAVSELFPLIYQELRRRAQQLMERERPDHTLQATALVNEAFLKMAGGPQVNWGSRRHFFNAASEAMRKILVDHARRKSAHKRGGSRHHIDIEDAQPLAENVEELDLDLLDHALARLQKLDERRYRVVMYRYFSGLMEEEVAGLLGVSLKTVRRDWKTARIFLRADLERAQAAR